ncbi:nuclear pore membrane glycoprotein 210-like [Taeniopygia guttata]|uniref:nuclear pore membrane glycoprotein 210-like n=1 Tax=Taeniopygia guttata TaxID=59729 RepID=UPI003BB97CD8
MESNSKRPIQDLNLPGVSVSNYHNPVLDLAAYDQQGRKCDNFSSLSIVWESTNKAIARIETELPMELTLKEEGNGQKKMEVDHAFGTAAISATATGFQQPHLKAARAQIPHEAVLPGPATIEVMLVEDVKVSPTGLSIYNHPDIQAELLLQQGSGYFFINTSVPNIVRVTHEETRGIALVQPLLPGSVTVMIQDLCLAFPAPAEAEIHVSDIQEFTCELLARL